MSTKPVFLSGDWPPADLDATRPDAPTLVDSAHEATEFAKLLEVLNTNDDPDDATTAVEALTVEQFRAPPASDLDTEGDNTHE